MTVLPDLPMPFLLFGDSLKVSTCLIQFIHLFCCSMCHMSEIKLSGFSFYSWLISLSIITSRFIHVAAKAGREYLNRNEYYNTGYGNYDSFSATQVQKNWFGDFDMTLLIRQHPYITLSHNYFKNFHFLRQHTNKCKCLFRPQLIFCFVSVTVNQNVGGKIGLQHSGSLELF